MDAFELLLRASNSDGIANNDLKDGVLLSKSRLPFDYRDHMPSAMLGELIPNCFPCALKEKNLQVV
jgi:hypothetical protein